MGKMRILKTLAVMAVLLSLTAVPALAKENGPIVATGGDAGEIIKIDPTTGTVSALTATGGEPAVTPDGKTVIFTKSSPDDSTWGYRLYAAPLDGSAEPAAIPATNANATGRQMASWPTVSPDGQTIYFFYYRTDPSCGGCLRYFGLASVPINGGSITEIPVDHDWFSNWTDPLVTPDGENLVYSQGDIKTVSVNGGASHILMQHEYNSETCDHTYYQDGLTISPDGQTVAATRWHQLNESCEGPPSPMESSIVTVPFSTTSTETPKTVPGTEARYTGTTSVDDAYVNFPAISPDGELLSFNKWALKDGKSAILSVPVAGGSPSVIMPYSTVFPRENEWAPAPADTTAPKVDAVNPDGTEGVARNTDVTATFSESMDPDTLSTSTFKLFKVNKNGTTSRITHAPVKLSADALTAKLNPFGSSDTRLAKNTRYKAVITTGATDVAGNALDQNDTKSGNQQKVWYFTTGTG